MPNLGTNFFKVSMFSRVALDVPSTVSGAFVVIFSADTRFSEPKNVEIVIPICHLG